MAKSIPLFIARLVICGGVLRIGQVATASCSAVECHLSRRFTLGKLGHYPAKSLLANYFRDHYNLGSPALFFSFTKDYQ
jgi:hypothetical protein